MQHYSRAGILEVDHFDPRKKNHVIQDYNNLFPASRFCNGKKSNKPKDADLRAGLRFLNPCEEVDYGDQIFEDPETGELEGSNAIATWHIRNLGLNAKHLKEERRLRRLYRKQLEEVGPVLVRGERLGEEAISNFLREVDFMISPIKPIPAKARV